MLEALLQLDQESFLFLNSLGTPGWDAFWLAISDKWVSIPLYMVLLFISFKAFGVKNTLVLMVAVALMITTTDQLANFFKYGVQRLRPCHEAHLEGGMRLVKGSCGGRFGFYSAHASNSMALVVFFCSLLYNRYKYLIFLLVIWATAVGYSRIYLGVHYPLDVLAGVLVGLVMGWLYARLYSLAILKLNR